MFLKLVLNDGVGMLARISNSPMRFHVPRIAIVYASIFLRGFYLYAFILLCARGVVGVDAATSDSAGIEYFERNIRPVLVENCYGCHSSQAEKGVRGEFNMETREGIRKGGEHGPGVVPGDPERSSLIRAIRYTDDALQMPPKNKKLPDVVIAHLEAWVKMGAPDPRDVATMGKKLPSAAETHWAFRPVAKPQPPKVRKATQVRSPVDAFVLEQLESKGLDLNPEADRRTLIRRLAFDLTGLPPKSSEIAQFHEDHSPNAYAALVDRFLGSPRYGERWGRYWLDVARYADTKGYVFEEERRYPYSYTYRDYVIRAFNEDLPYDQFVKQQLAADLMPLGDDKRPLAALGFLTLGRRFLNNPHDIIDDRIDVMTRGLMGMTVVCARCHDHKFDPISTRDYYSLYGVFASTHEPDEKPLLGDASLPKEYPEFLAERKRRVDEKAQYRSDRDAEAKARVRSQLGSYLLAVHEARELPEGEGREKLIRERKLEPAVARKFFERYDGWSNQPSALLLPWFAFARISGSNFIDRVASARSSIVASNASLVLSRFSNTNPPTSLKQVSDVYNSWGSGAAKVDASSTNSGLAADIQIAADFFAGNASPFQLNADELHRLFDTPAQQKLRALQRKIDELDATHLGAPPRAMALVDNATPHDPHVFRRGSPGNVGDAVPRQFLEVVSGKSRKPFQKGSGRLEMAEAIVSRDNPLTARVWVNRVWAYHFGNPLVKTPSDFGVRSDPPSHAALLDYLANRFMEEGWSTKKLHRWILMSATYRQSSDQRADADRVDPANQLYARQNRRRLDFESMRDTLLAASGQVDLTVGGHPVDITTEPFTTRRTVYGFVERQNLPGLFRTFDFASPDSTSAQRFSTTVPQQALFLMNSPFAVQQARALVELPEMRSSARDEEKLRVLFQRLYQRDPDAQEMKMARGFLRDAKASVPMEAENPVWRYGYGEVDVEKGRVSAFHDLPYFSNYAWQGSKTLPDPKVGWVLLNPDGGHPGGNPGFAAIRRWMAPRDGTVSVKGDLGHPGEQGDGVRGRIVSSRSGVLGQWVAMRSTTNTVVEKIQVKAGDTVDFVTDCRSNESFDTFSWIARVKYTGEEGKGEAPRLRWQTKDDFKGPQPAAPKSLDPWEKLAQAILLSNEVFFID